MNLFDRNGHFINHQRVEESANQVNISLRTGCFCNPGGGEMALGLTAGELTVCFASHARMEYQDFRRCIDDKSTGAVRISTGMVSTFADVYRLMSFISGFLECCEPEA